MAKNNCKLQMSCEDGILVASLEGELDHHGAVAVRTLIDAKILHEKPKKMVIELAHLDFMDSSGIGLIMGRYALIQRPGGKFVSDGSPWVAQRVCPIPQVPISSALPASLASRSESLPLDFTVASLPFSDTVIPAES